MTAGVMGFDLTQSDNNSDASKIDIINEVVRRTRSDKETENVTDNQLDIVVVSQLDMPQIRQLIALVLQLPENLVVDADAPWIHQMSIVMSRLFVLIQKY
ncbi:hypothetical protein RHO15_08930 [Utexia brackfieldae]|uniref:hypothetical protein n=1 Tax=Utexia brackfieldae TaxID=3074108 RepID=UPI00370D6C19